MLSQVVIVRICSSSVTRDTAGALNRPSLVNLNCLNSHHATQDMLFMKSHYIIAALCSIVTVLKRAAAAQMVLMTASGRPEADSDVIYGQKIERVHIYVTTNFGVSM